MTEEVRTFLALALFLLAAVSARVGYYFFQQTKRAKEKCREIEERIKELDEQIKREDWVS